MIDESILAEVVALQKRLDKVRRTSAAVGKAKRSSLIESIELLSKLHESLAGLQADKSAAMIAEAVGSLELMQAQKLEDRREELGRAAQAAGWKHARKGQYDVVDCFRVDYKGVNARISFGDDVFLEIKETDGVRLFERLVEKKTALKSVPFEREAFLVHVRAAIAMAKLGGFDRDGAVPVRELHPFVALARMGSDQKFRSRPEAKTFTAYPLEQFAFDLARFGLGGWKMPSGERLTSQTPNMASISKKVTLMLPALDGAQVEQVGLLKFERAPTA